MPKIKVLPLTLSIGICFLAAAIGSVFTTSAIDTWYVTLNKPFFNPPNWVFAPVWSILYLTMAISLYLVWNGKGEKKEKSLGIKYFFAQLILNTLWSILFFGLKSPPLAFLGILLLWVAICLTIRSFSRISKAAELLLIPYLAWVSFATILNLTIVLLNP